MTPATEGPTKAIKGADHKRPTTHWRLTPGQAWKLSPEGNEAVTIDKALCAKSEYTFCLVWIRGATAAVFQVGRQEYAQPLRPVIEKRVRQPRPAPGVKEIHPQAGSPEESKPDVLIASGKARRVKVRKPLTLEPP